MAPIIIPAVFPKTKEDLNNFLKKVKIFSKFTQIDIVDGKFVKNKTISLKEIVNQKLSFDNLFL
jgi:pentose-5-phosphate-3-epimerase